MSPSIEYGLFDFFKSKSRMNFNIDDSNWSHLYWLIFKLPQVKNRFYIKDHQH